MPAEPTDSWGQISRLNTHMPDCESLNGTLNNILVVVLNNQLPHTCDFVMAAGSSELKRSVVTNSRFSLRILAKIFGSSSKGYVRSASPVAITSPVALAKPVL